jgi:hypothetical protein
VLVFPIIYFITPYTALIQDPTARYAIFLSVLLIKGFVVIIGFPCTTILLTNSASSLRILGTLNGFATTFSGMGRAVGPALVGAVFTWGVRHGYAIAPWWLLGVIGMLGAIPSWFIVEGEGPTRSLGAGDGGAAEEESLLANGEEDEDVAMLEAVGGEESDSGSDTMGTTKGRKVYGTVQSSDGASR